MKKKKKQIKDSEDIFNSYNKSLSYKIWCKDLKKMVQSEWLDNIQKGYLNG